MNDFKLYGTVLYYRLVFLVANRSRRLRVSGSCTVINAVGISTGIKPTTTHLHVLQPDFVFGCPFLFSLVFCGIGGVVDIGKFD